MKNQINKVNVEKASVNLMALDVLKSVKEKNQGLFKTALGTKQIFIKKNCFWEQTRNR